ncbi:hypothetical protein Q0590_01425 [Rhodocytophaga aerolata]|uniref:Uncharacterized protein n=1 Tax=Rhodocytophaga aerolata TaxID=455078 RepID=A0ABT8QYH1_9BACT|nr:hypothetical protein [Rhodocytophaga aerolata]MDO1444887.1 hypothetical protein [Rhodocytophaga aerolata]
MTTNQQHILSMYQTVLSYMDAKPTMWNTIGPIVKSVFMFRTYVTALIQQMYIQPGQMAALYMQDKDGHMLAMSDMSLAILLKVRAYAKASNNKALLYAINYSENELRTGSEIHIVKRCQTIYNKAKDHLAELTKYGVTEERLSQLQHAINTVRPMITHRNAVANKKLAAMVNVPLLIEEARAELEKLDELVKTTIFDRRYIKMYMQLRNQTEMPLHTPSVQMSSNNLQLS